MSEETDNPETLLTIEYENPAYTRFASLGKSDDNVVIRIRQRGKRQALLVIPRTEIYEFARLMQSVAAEAAV